MGQQDTRTLYENRVTGRDAFPADDDASPSYLAAIVESSDDAIVSKNLQGIVTSWNAAAERLFGWKSDEMVGASILRIIPPELRAEEDHIIGRVKAGEKVDHFRTVRMRKDGSRVHVSITVSPVKDSEGRIIGASKIARDETERRELDEARSRLAAIVESSEDAIISKDLGGTVMSWNAGAERLYGYKASEMIGRPIMRIIPPELLHEEDEILARVRAGQGTDHFETKRLRKDGTRVEVAITVSPMKDRFGRVIGASKIARDISSQREAEREKDRFLAILAHELRNPLAPIRNAVTLFGAANVSEEQRARARDIAERQVSHMAKLLDDLLDVARISTGRVEIKKADIALRPIVQHAVDALRPMMAARRHRLHVTSTDEDLWIHADEVRILQIVSNLLTNAAKYTDPGGDIQLSLRRDGDYAEISVDDNGIGFTHETQQRLFTLFSQAREVRGRADGGLGIGLALVREFVERHGGTVTAYSAGPGRGSRFVVRLPRLRKTQAAT